MNFCNGKTEYADQLNKMLHYLEQQMVCPYGYNLVQVFSFCHIYLLEWHIELILKSIHNIGSS